MLSDDDLEELVEKLNDDFRKCMQKIERLRLLGMSAECRHEITKGLEGIKAAINYLRLALSENQNPSVALLFDKHEEISKQAIQKLEQMQKELNLN